MNWVCGGLHCLALGRMLFGVLRAWRIALTDKWKSTRVSWCL